MAIVLTPINVGTAPNDNTGDKIRNGGIIINENFAKLLNLSGTIQSGGLHVYKYPGNVDLTTIEQNDIVEGFIEILANKYFIRSQYNTGSLTDFGTLAGDFNDGSYTTFDYTDI